MTATDELRKLLDERGVEWWKASPCKTKWHSPVLGGPVAVREWNGKMVLDAGYVNVTPEQAIAATLGRGTCHATSNPPVPKHWTGCSNCGSVWDFFYNICGYMGPPNFCPKCGAKVVDA